MCDAAERDHGRMVAGIDRDQLGVVGDAGIAGGAVEPLDQGARGDLPGQRVLAAAGADEKDVHCLKSDAVQGGGGVSFRGATQQTPACAVPMIGAGSYP